MTQTSSNSSNSNRDNDSPATTSSSKLDNSSSSSEEESSGNNNNNNNSNSSGNNTPVEECNSQLGNEEHGGTGEGCQPPALPPRPPNLGLSGSHIPHPPHAFTNSGVIAEQQIRNGMATGQYNSNSMASERPKNCFLRALSKKYILLCCMCGGLTLTIGVLYLVIFFMLKTYTTSLQYFQTLPMYIPSVVLIVTGLLVMCFSRRGNRNSYLIKVCGICCLCSAVLCVVVTVTTTVIHMNRLQTLRECVYQGSTQTCTCFAAYMDTGHHSLHHHDPALRFVFAGTPDCDVIHGVLYSCLRALFGLSVIGILVCIFSCMLVYQLLSHEKKKKYWEQLEQRCRHLYRGGGRPPLGHGPYVLGGAGGANLSSLLLGPSPLSCHNFLGSSPMTANTTMTNLSQCGYCNSEDGFHNLVLPGAGSCSSGLMNGTGQAAPTTATTTSSTDGYGCHWQTTSIWDAIHDDRFLTRHHLGNGGCGNLYTPNPVEASSQAHNLSSILSNNSCSSSNNNNNNSCNSNNDNNDSTSPTGGGQLRSSWSLRSFRSWLPWVNSSQPQQPTSTAENRSNVPSVAGVVQRRTPSSSGTSDPRWRHSNPDSHYGFRTTSFLQSGQLYHCQQRVYPQQQQQQQQQPLQWRYDGMEGHYALPEQLPRYLWGPPPPYSQPPSLENIREATAAASSTQNLASAGSVVSATGLASPTSAADSTRSRTQPPPPLARTTKSGLLVSSSSDYSLNTHNNNNINSNNMHSAMSLSAYDESVKSAVHVYEQANELRRKRIKNNREESGFNYCNSLPTRKLKKKTDRGVGLTLAGFKSTANLPDAILSLETGHNMSIFAAAATNVAVMSPTSRLATSPNRCIALQTTSRQQSLPLPPIPAQKPKRSSGDIYRPSSVVSRSSCSTTENKYETIGKSLSPYKIVVDNTNSRPHAGIFGNKQTGSKLRSSLDSSSFSSASPSGDSDQGYGFGSTSVSPMSLGNSSGVSAKSNGNSNNNSNKTSGVSSHYAQISPLRGEGLPPPGRMGLTSGCSSAANTNPNSPLKSYFQAIQRQGACTSATSLPNVNSMVPLSSPQSFSTVQQPQQQQQQQHCPTTNNVWRSRDNISSPLHQQQQQQQHNNNNNNILQFNTVQRLNEKYNSSNPGRGLGFMKSRFYSASSEMVNSPTANNNNNSNNSVNYLVSPPPHYPSQLKRFSPFFTQTNQQQQLQQQPIHTHKSLENLDGSSNHNFGGSTPVHSSGAPVPFSHQKRRRPLYSHNNPYSATNKDESGFTGVPVSRGCVYLRPEQNIPDVFSTAFKPINENNMCKADDDDEDDDKPNGGDSNTGENQNSGDPTTISRDDIVVTMRSVNV